MIYCISDIHGDFAHYKAMLEHIGFSDTDTLYVIGDVIDRHPAGVDILLDIMELPHLYEADPGLDVLEIRENCGYCQVDFRPSEVYKHFADVLADMESAIESQSAIICENCGEYIKGKPTRYTSYCKRCFYLPISERFAVREAMKEKYFRHSHVRHGEPLSREEVRGKRLNDFLDEMTESLISNAAGSSSLSEEDQGRIRLPANEPDKMEEVVVQLVEKHEVLKPDK